MSKPVGGVGYVDHFLFFVGNDAFATLLPFTCPICAVLLNWRQDHQE